MFQFQYGSIVTLFRFAFLDNFQFVSIPVWFDCDSFNFAFFVLLKTGFNSSMVRLWHTTVYDEYEVYKAFQFQYGSIVTSNTKSELTRASSFQFQYGSIVTKDIKYILEGGQ